MDNDIEWTNQWCNWGTIIREQSRAKYRTLQNTIAEVDQIGVLSRHKHWVRSIGEIWGYPWQSRARDARVCWESVQANIMRNSVKSCWQIKEYEKTTCIIVISCVGLLGVMMPLKIEIIHIVPIVNNCICLQRVIHVALSVFTQAACYHYVWTGFFAMEQSMWISLNLCHMRVLFKITSHNFRKYAHIYVLHSQPCTR